MGTPWGMINARREAEQARDAERIVRKSLVDLIKAVEVALQDLQNVEESRQVQKKLHTAVENAKKGLQKP